MVTAWQEGADALIEQYKEAVETTFQINAICKNVSQMLPETVVHIYIDECWVTVPKRFSPHMTDVRYKVIS